MNQIPPAPSGHPADAPDPPTPAQPTYEELDRELSAPRHAPTEEPARPATPEEAPAPDEKQTEASSPPAPRPPAMPPPLPTFGAPQSPPRFAAPPQRPPGPPAQPAPPFAPQLPAEQPTYPPRISAPQPAPPGGMAEPPRPYEGGRYVPPPPIPATGPPVPGRDWAPANTTVALPAAPVAVARPGAPMTTALLGIIAALLLALAIFQGITTFHPKAASPTGVQQVQVQKQPLKAQTAAEVKDTTDKAQTALNQLNQNVQTAYAGATTDAQRQAVLLQSLIVLEQIIAQQNNDLLLIYQDLNS
ncbi:MAG: hypothetical protein LC793_16345 [Thermomicrobia bacterium]|nr:hypothetical protein [Thermomicrobia bacterium]